MLFSAKPKTKGKPVIATEAQSETRETAKRVAPSSQPIHARRHGGPLCESSEATMTQEPAQLLPPTTPAEIPLPSISEPRKTDALWDAQAEAETSPLSSVECEAFDVEAALKRSNAVIHPSAHGLQNIIIFTLNMDGLQTKYKKDSLRALARHLQFTNGVITGTHLLKPEVEALQIPGYRIIDDQGTSKHRGGVLIMAKTETPRKKVTRTQWPPDPINTCSVLLSPRA